MKRWIAIVASVLLVFATGFFREFLFVSINFQLKELLNDGKYDYPLAPSLSFLESWEYWPLYWSKWFLTAFFCAAFFAETLLLIRFIFGQWSFRPVLFFYGLLVLLAVLSFGTGWLLHDINEGYLFSRFFLGLLQSPFPPVILVPAMLLKKRMAQPD